MTSTASEDRRRNIFYTGTATASVQYLPERPAITSDQRHARSTLTFNGSDGRRLRTAWPAAVRPKMRSLLIKIP